MSFTTFWGLTCTVEMALSAATGTYGAWNVGLWDTATWGPDIVWTDVSNYVRSVNTTRRFSRDFHGWDGGSATVALNNEDGRFSAANLSGPYVVAGVTQVRPWRPVRIRFGWAGKTYTVFYGYGVDWAESWEQPFPGGGGAIMTVSCLDEFGSLARFDGSGQLPTGGGETTGQRIHRILDNAGHTGTRDVEVGRMTVQATTLSSNAVSDLKLTADSEGGAVYVGADGVVIFRNLYSLIEDTTSNTLQATFGDANNEIPYGNVAAEHNGDLLTNIAAFNRTNGNVMTSTDATSRALYGDKRETRSDLVDETDPQVQTLADLWVQRYKDPELRFTEVTLKCRGNSAVLIPQALGRSVRDLVRVRRRPPGGYVFSQDVFISGISHAFTGDDLVTVFDLSSSQPYASYTTSRFGTGMWDSATWFY